MYTKRVFLTDFTDLYLPHRAIALLIVVAIALLAAHMIVAARREERGRTIKGLLCVALPLAGVIVALLYSSAYRWSVRGWYFAWGLPMAAAFAGMTFAQLERLLTPYLKRVPALAVQSDTVRGFLMYSGTAVFLLAVYLVPASDLWRIDQYSFRRPNYDAAHYLNTNTTPGARVASFNAGIIGYLSERTVINVDGVVNKDAFDASKDRRLLAYIRDVDAEYLADSTAYLTAIAPFVTPDDWTRSIWGEDPNRGLELIQRAGPEGAWQMSVWRVLRTD